MTVLFASPSPAVPLSPGLLRPGQPVHVNARDTWMEATIVSRTRTLIALTYPARPIPARSGPRPVSPVPAWLVRPADGVCLQPIEGLRAGLNVLTFDGTPLRVAAVRQRRDRWWDIHYTAAEHSMVPPRAVLRVADPTPIVTVHGRPVRAALTPPESIPAAPDTTSTSTTALRKGILL